MRELLRRFKVNKKFLLSMPVALISLQIYLGIIFGYFLGKFLSGEKTGQSGVIRSIVLNFGNYRLHLHHWILSLGVLIFNFLTSFSFPFPQFSLSLLGGFAIQGIICYSDWYKILIRIRNN